MYVLAFADRANIGYAKNVLQADTGISNTAFAFGAGLFFIGYALFEIPSNLIFYRVGARRWLSRIMFSWGLVAAATAFTHNATSFYMLRFLLGVTEAGFFPGIILYLTLWFPARARAQTVGLFYFGLPLALVVSGPLSGLLLDLNPFSSIKGWQFMFVIQGLLASCVGVAAYFYLTDRPSEAAWLSEPEKIALVDALALEEEAKRHAAPQRLWKAVSDLPMMMFCFVYATIQIGFYGVVFYLPTRIAAFAGGHVGTMVGLITTIPWLAAICTTYAVTRLADRRGGHRVLAAAMLAMAIVAIAASALCHTMPLAILSFCFATSGFVSVQPLFWSLPTRYLAGAGAAGGIGLINAIGNLGALLLRISKTMSSARPEAFNWAPLRWQRPGLSGQSVFCRLFREHARRRAPNFHNPKDTVPNP